MAQVRSPDCDCPGALHYSDSTSGGNAGGGISGTFTVPAGFTATWSMSVEAYTQKDGFTGRLDTYVVFTTGCIAGSAGVSGTVGPGTHSYSLDCDNPDCENLGPGTVWDVEFSVDQDRC